MVFPKVSLLIACVAGVCLSQTSRVSGVVHDSVTSLPLSGVVVKMIHSYQSDTTDVYGRFSISFTSSIRGKSLPGIGKLFTVDNGALRFSLPARSTVRIDAYTVNGRLISSLTDNWDAGDHFIPSLVKASGTYLYRIRIGDRCRTAKFIRMDDGRRGITFHSRQKEASDSYEQTGFAKRLEAQAKYDSLQFIVDGYDIKRVRIIPNVDDMSVLMHPVELNNGVEAGRWELGSSRGTKMYVYVDETGKAVDSINATVALQCISSSHNFTYSVKGPFDIPRNGVLTIGDTVKLNFTTSSLTGSFQTDQVISKTTSTQCDWTEIVYFGGGGYMTKMMSHYNHVFKRSIPTLFYDTFYELQIDAQNGTVKKSPDKAFYLPGSRVRLTAVPDSMYGFRSWSGVDSVFGAESTQAIVVMNGPRTISAEFGGNYYLTMDYSSERGRCSPKLSSHPQGDTVRIVAFPESGYYLSAWVGDILKSDKDTVWILMDSSKTVSADFDILYQLRITAENGRVEKKPWGNYYRPQDKDTVQLVAVPDSGYIFLRWGQQTIKESHDTAWVVMDDTTKSVTAYFGSDKISMFHNKGANQARFSPDGLTVGFGTTSGIQMVDLQTGEYGTKILCEGDDFQFFSDGTKVLCSGSETNLFDFVSGEKITTLNSSRTNVVAVSPNDSIFAAGTFGVTLYNTNSGSKIVELPEVSGIVKQIGFSPDGSKIVVGTLSAAKIYDVSTASLLHGLEEQPLAFRFAPDSSMHILLRDGHLLHLDVSTWDTISVYETGVSGHCADFSHDGTKLAIGTWNRGLKIMELSSKDFLHQFDHVSPIINVEFSPDGSQVVTSGIISAIWDLR